MPVLREMLEETWCQVALWLEAAPLKAQAQWKRGCLMTWKERRDKPPRGAPQRNVSVHLRFRLETQLEDLRKDVKRSGAALGVISRGVCSYRFERVGFD